MGFARALSAPDGAKGGVVEIGGSAPRSWAVCRWISSRWMSTDFEAGTAARGSCHADRARLTIETMGQASGTIGYEVLTRLGPRFQRRFVGAKAETWPKPSKSNFVCQNCGAVLEPVGGKVHILRRVEHHHGRSLCRAAAGHRPAKGFSGVAIQLEGLDGVSKEAPACLTGMPELDRVTGRGHRARLGAADRG